VLETQDLYLFYSAGAIVPELYKLKTGIIGGDGVGFFVGLIADLILNCDSQSSMVIRTNLVLVALVEEPK